MMEMQSVWGWQPALYLFLGGMGAGAFVTAAVLFLVGGKRYIKTISISMWLSCVALAAGLLCLLTELTNPLRGLLLWQSFSNGTSWMTFGAWIVLAAVIVFGVAAVLATEKTVSLLAKIWKTLPEKRFGAVKVLAVIGLLLGIGVAAYTGVLLMSASGVPFWNTWLLPVLFTVSALDTGVALVEVVSVANAKREPLSGRVHGGLSATVVVLVLIEAVVLFAFVQAMLAGNGLGESAPGAAAAAVGSASLLVSGQLAPFFWVLVAACGLAVPLIVAVVSLASRRKAIDGGSAAEEPVEVLDRKKTCSDDKFAADKMPVEKTAVKSEAPPAHAGKNATMLIGALGALAGGCALRFVVVLAGIHADAVADTAAFLFADMLSRL